MSEEDEAGTSDRELIDMIDEFANDVPTQFFRRETTTDSTAVRAQNHAIYCIIDQLRKPISIEAESMTKWIIYKQAGAHRHQSFFGFFRTLGKFVRKFNDMGLVKRINNVYKRATNAGDNLYLLENDAIRYIGCAFLQKLFILQQIQRYSVKAADSTMGMLELEHWQHLSLVIVAICGEIHGEVVKQLTDFENMWKFVVKIFRSVDKRFPETFAEMTVVRDIKEASCAFDAKSVDLSIVSRLMKFTSEKISDAQQQNQIEILKTEVLNELLAPKTPSTSNSETLAVTSASLDIGVSISRKDLSMMNSTLNDSTIDNDSLLSPSLFGTQKLSKKAKKLGKKRENAEKLAEIDAKKPKTCSFLASTMSLFEEKSGKKKKKKSK